MMIPRKKQNILGWALTKLRKFRVSKLPYFYNLDRESNVYWAVHHCYS